MDNQNNLFEDHENPDIQPITKNAPHSSSLPCPIMKVDGGRDGNHTYFLPMKTREAFAIRALVKVEAKLAVKLEIALAGVNVAAPTPELGQDYFVATNSNSSGVWIDGHAAQKDPRLVRQFVVINPGTGHSVLDQLKLRTASTRQIIDISVTVGHEKQNSRPDPSRQAAPRRSRTWLQRFTDQKKEDEGFQFFVKGLTGKFCTLSGMKPETPIQDVVYHLQYIWGIPPENMRLIFAGHQLQFERTLADYQIITESTVHLSLRLRGGNPPLALTPLTNVEYDPGDTIRDLNIGPGGLIYQPNTEDPGVYQWGESPIGHLKIRIVNFDRFKIHTGLTPPELPPLPTGDLEFDGYNNGGRQIVESIAHHQKTTPSQVPVSEPRLPKEPGTEQQEMASQTQSQVASRHVGGRAWRTLSRVTRKLGSNHENDTPEQMVDPKTRSAPRRDRKSTRKNQREG
ncbi:Fc.00g002320.m01.CDS01 [Cosmosporella sp. VM-42]